MVQNREQPRLRQAYAYAQSLQSLCCSYTISRIVDEGSGKFFCTTDSWAYTLSICDKYQCLLNIFVAKENTTKYTVICDGHSAFKSPWNLVSIVRTRSKGFSLAVC